VLEMVIGLVYEIIEGCEVLISKINLVNCMLFYCDCWMVGVWCFFDIYGLDVVIMMFGMCVLLYFYIGL